MKEGEEQSFDGTFNENIRSAAYRAQGSRKHKVVVNVAETQYAVIKHVARKNKCFLQTDPSGLLSFDLCWTDNHVKAQLFARMQPHQRINHFPGMAILSRKNHLGSNLMTFRRHFPLEYDFFPITWTLPTDLAQLQAYHECRQQGKAQTFIVKPQAACQGRGIFLTRHLERIKQEKCVVQRYMHKPYLIDGLKFDLRIYVVVTGIDPLRIFVFEEGLARFATEEYRAPRSENLDNKFMHLTNYAINKDHPNFIFNKAVDEMDRGHKRSLTAIWTRLESEGHDVQALRQRIYDIFVKTIITGYPTLSQTGTAVHADNFANDMCFEVLGFDVMLDARLNPYLLEINYTPSFTADTPLDCYIKKKLIADLFRLLGLNEKWKKQAKAKRDKEVQQRMLSGKRKKYSQEERIQFMKEEAKRRNQQEANFLGGFTKIFATDHAQFMQYKPYFDFAVDHYITLNKAEHTYFQGFNRLTRNDFPYTHLYDSKIYQKHIQKNVLKDQQRYFQRDMESRQQQRSESRKEKVKKIGKEKQNDMQSFMSKSGQGHLSLSTNKRVSSAKGRKEKRIVYDRVESKKSLNEDVKKSLNEDGRYCKKQDDDVISNVSLFHNKNLQQLALKKKNPYQDFEDDQIG